MPLSYMSQHPSSVHLSWPLAETRRMHDRSFYASDSFKFRSLKISRFEETFMADPIVQKCRSWQPGSSAIPRCPDPATRKVHEMVPFSYSERWRIHKYVSLWNQTWGDIFQRKYGVRIRLIIAWSAAGSSLKSRAMAVNKQITAR